MVDREYCKPVCQSFQTTFCPVCGRADKETLKGVRVMGFVGVAHTLSPRVEAFFETGDPTVLNRRPAAQSA